MLRAKDSIKIKLQMTWKDRKQDGRGDKTSVANKPKPRRKSKFKKRNEAKEAKVLKFAKMWKEM
jgi:hypothetical protein